MKFGTQEYLCYLGYIRPSVQGHLGSFGALVSKLPVSRKRAGCRVKWGEIWDWGYITCIYGIMGTFDIPGFRVILGVIQCTCLEMACNSRMIQ